jgi:hypothetical protein
LGKHADNAQSGLVSDNYVQKNLGDSNGSPVDGVSFTFGDGSVVEANQVLASPDVPECGAGPGLE